jgi:peptidoglycan LD-endopeptidase CwlK
MSRDIHLLKPDVMRKCDQWMALMEKAGIDFIITQTFRTKADQDAIYAQGRTKPGNIVTKAKYPQSPHCWGVAWDFAIKVDGKVTWGHPELYKKAGLLAESMGLTWGGHFKSFVDTPHIEDPTYCIGKSINTLKAKYKTPENFIKTWQEVEEVEPVKIVVGNETMQGFIKDGLSYAPVKQLSLALGAKVSWNAEQKKVTVQK